MDDIATRRRKRHRKRKIRRMCFFGTVFILAVIVVIAVHGIKKSNNVTPIDDTAFEETEVVYPQKPETEPKLDTAVLKQDGVKTCYLTFDDGPTLSVTPRILDILRRYNAKATFFMVGTLIENNKSTARRVYDEGHCLANHSYAHNYSEFYASEESFMNEINKTYELIFEVTGDKNYPKVFRFPGGGYNAGSYGEAKQNYKEVLKRNGIRYCDWNALNGDAEGKKRTADELCERVKKTTADKEDVVILMHDAAAKSTTADALPQVLEYLISQGYVFKTLDKAPIV